jgi:hypothetical protein
MNKKNTKAIVKITAILLLNVLSNGSFAQIIEMPETLEDKIDTLYSRTEALMSDMDYIKKLKFSGYVQAQYQLADTAGAKGNSYAGGAFDANVNNRFLLRRSRIKMSYDNNDEFGNTITQLVMQMDLFSSGTAVIRDFYGKFTDPWTRWFGIKAGAMDKPFGYELTYSSGTRETPERGRMSQLLFPGEKDFGAQFVIQPVKQSRFNFFKLETGLYNGAGVLNNDFDKKKDWISRLSFFKSNFNETVKYSGGLSYYNGGHKYGTKNNVELSTLANGTKSWMLQDSNTTNLTKIGKAIYYGVDAQVSIDWKGGLSTFRAEAMMGQQPGTAKSTATPRTLVTEDLYLRNFNGAYLYFVQNILHTHHNIIVKYDVYDPNTDIKGTEIVSNLTSSDIKYSTLGIGYLFNYDQNWKFLIYKDFVKNESTSLSGYTSDVKKDNVLTLRIQYTFNKYQ